MSFVPALAPRTELKAVPALFMKGAAALATTIGRINIERENHLIATTRFADEALFGAQLALTNVLFAKLHHLHKSLQFD